MVFSAQSDIARGREAVRIFHNTSRQFYPSAYLLTEDQLLAAIGKNHPEIFLDSLGMAIREIDMSTGQVEDAMELLATRAAGRIPPSQYPFFQALSNRMQDISFGDFVAGSPQIALGMAKDIGTGFQAVGNAVIDTGKSLLQIGPLVIVIGIAFIFYARVRQTAGR